MIDIRDNSFRVKQTRTMIKKHIEWKTHATYFNTYFLVPQSFYCTVIRILKQVFHLAFCLRSR